MRPARVIRSAIVLKPSTIMDFHRMLRNRKYRLLFSPKRRGRTGPKGPSTELVAAIAEMKRRNPMWGCPRIAEQIGLIFDIQIDKDVVRRVLATHYRPDPDSSGPSWLTFLGMRKTACEASTYSDASPRFCEAIGCSWSWTNTRGGSSASASMLESWMAAPCDVCSTTRFEGNRVRRVSAPTTIRCTGSTNGTPTFGFYG